MKKGDSVSIGDKNATIKWVVDTEVGVIFDNGETAVIDSIKCPITILVESAPVYQTSVEHMTDEQLRASIEELRNRRILKPLTKTKVTVKEEPVSEEHKKIDAIFKGKTPEEIIVLKRKLGWID